MNRYRFLSIIGRASASIIIITFVACGSGAMGSNVTYDSSDIEVETVAGDGTAGDVDGEGSTAQFNEPDGVTFTDEGDIYITDMGNHEVKHIADDGTVTTVAGTGEEGYVDGDASVAQFSSPDGIVSDSEGNVYVGDSGNNVIRKITPEGVVSTFAGTGEAGDSDGAADEAKLNFPTGITVDSEDNLYVVDENNNKIKKVTPEGEVSTFAGNGTAAFADGDGASASFDKPHGITADADDNIYVTDQNNNRIRKITPGAIVSTVAGNGTAGYSDGNALGASMNKPHGIGVDSDGEVYFADEDNSVVRKISAGGEVTTYAGDGEAGFDDGSGRQAKFNKPRGVAVGWNKDVYICDYSNNRVRKVKKND